MWKATPLGNPAKNKVYSHAQGEIHRILPVEQAKQDAQPIAAFFASTGCTGNTFNEGQEELVADGLANLVSHVVTDLAKMFGGAAGATILAAFASWCSRENTGEQLL